jgi:cytochrome P450
MKTIPRRSLIPVLTDLLEYREAAKNTIPYTRKMVDRYGDVCQVAFTGINNYFIHDPEVIKEILTTYGPKMKRTYFFRAFRKYLGEGLFTSDGEHHKQQRKLIKPAFYPQRIESYASIMTACAAEEAAGWKDGASVNINQAMTRITLKVITKAMFSSGLNDEVLEETGRNLQASFDLMNRILSNPVYVYCLVNDIPVPIVKKLYRLKAEVDKVINGIIASYRKSPDASRTDLLSMLMEARDEETGRGMSDTQIRDEVITVFLAGHETTTIALTWTWYLIAKHPEQGKKMQEEIKAITGDRLPQASDYLQLHYTKNIFRESLRLYPPAWTFARSPVEDVVIRDYHFPKDAVLWTITYLLHHNEKYFHDAEKFIPGRWDEASVKEMPKYAYCPFGGGLRMCIGEGFAWMEGVLVLATIASKYKLELPENYTVEINPVFTLKTKQDVMMKVKKL